MKNDEFLVEMGLRIADRRKELHLTQEQLAESIDVSLQTISCIELGKKAVRPENLAKLCKSLNITSDYILYGKRNTEQMNKLIDKLSSLGKEEYNLVSDLVFHFDKLCAENEQVKRNYNVYDKSSKQKIEGDLLWLKLS